MKVGVHNAGDAVVRDEQAGFFARAQFVQQRVEARRQLQHRLAAAKPPGKAGFGGLEVRAVAGRALEPAEVLFAQALLHLQRPAGGGRNVAGGIQRAGERRGQNQVHRQVLRGQHAAQRLGLGVAARGQGNVGRAADLVLHIPERFAVAGKVQRIGHGPSLPFYVSMPRRWAVRRCRLSAMTNISARMTAKNHG